MNMDNTINEIRNFDAENAYDKIGVTPLERLIREVNQSFYNMSNAMRSKELIEMAKSDDACKDYCHDVLNAINILHKATSRLEKSSNSN